MWVRNAGNAQLAWSTDRGKTWAWADWKLTTSFGCPTFLNFGKDYAGARDEFVYVYSPDADGAYDSADRMVLARVPKDRIKDRDAYEFFRGLSDGKPLWTRDVKDRAAVLDRTREVLPLDGHLQRRAEALPVVRDAARSGRRRAPTAWRSTTPRSRGGRGRRRTSPSGGTWTPGESAGFPSKWMSADGKTLHLVFAGGDAFCVRKAEIVPRDSEPDAVLSRRCNNSLNSCRWSVLRGH